MNFYELFGFLGTFIVVAAYLPQIFHLAKVKRAEGVSLAAWFSWLVGTGMILVYALTAHDLIFILFQALSFISILAIIILTIKYKKPPIA